MSRFNLECDLFLDVSVHYNFIRCNSQTGLAQTIYAPAFLFMLLLLARPRVPLPSSTPLLALAASVVGCRHYSRALHSLVHSCKISTRTRLRSLPPSLAFSLLHACFARPASHPGLSLTRDPAGAYRSTPTLALGFKRRVVVSRGTSTFCMHVRGHDVGVAAATSGANDEAGAQRAGTRRATRLSVLRASRDTAKGRHRGVDEGHRHFACNVRGHDVGVAATFACISDVTTVGLR